VLPSAGLLDHHVPGTSAGSTGLRLPGRSGTNGPVAPGAAGPRSRRRPGPPGKAGPRIHSKSPGIRSPAGPAAAYRGVPGRRGPSDGRRRT
jgi:hypothetical protein